MSQQVKAGLITGVIITSIILVAIYVWLFFNGRENGFFTGNTTTTIQKVKGGDIEENINTKPLWTESPEVFLSGMKFQCSAFCYLSSIAFV